MKPTRQVKTRISLSLYNWNFNYVKSSNFEPKTSTGSSQLRTHGIACSQATKPQLLQFGGP